MNLKKIVKLAVSILICNMAGFIGSFFTLTGSGSWYELITKPSFNPPNWVFGPVWTTLFVLMGIALYFVWEKGLDKKEVQIAIGVFGVQLVLNTLWSFLFFGLKSPLYGLIEIFFLWIAILASIFLFYRIDKKAGYLLVPYIVWVSFAIVLNYSIWVLNIA